MSPPRHRYHHRAFGVLPSMGSLCRAVVTFVVLGLVSPPPVPADEDVRSVTPFDGQTRGAVVDTQGTRAVTWGRDDRLVIHDLAQGTTLASVRAEGLAFGASVALSADGTVLAASRPRWLDGRPGVWLWNALHGTPLSVQQQRDLGPARWFRSTEGVVALQVGRFQRTLVVGRPGTLRASPRPGDTGWALHPDGKRLVQATREPAPPHDLRLTVHGVDTGQRLQAWNLPGRAAEGAARGGPPALAVGADKILVLAGARARLVSMETGTVAAEVEPGVTAVATHADGWLLGHADGRVTQHDARLVEVSAVSLPGGAVRHLQAAGTRWIAQTRTGHHRRHHAFRDGRRIHSSTRSQEARITADAFLIRTGSGATWVQAGDAPPWTHAAAPTEYPQDDARIRRAHLAGDRALLPADGTVDVHDLRAGARRGTLRGHHGRILDLRWLDDGHVQARGGTRGHVLTPRQVAVVDVAGRIRGRVESSAGHWDGARLQALEGAAWKARGAEVVAPGGGARAQWRHDAGIRIVGPDGKTRGTVPTPGCRHGASLAFAPDGTHLLTAWATRSPTRVFVALVDVRTGRALWQQDLGEGAYPVDGVAFTPDGRHLLLDLRDLVVLRRDGSERARLRVGPANPGRAWDVDRAGRWLWGAAFDGPVHVLDLSGDAPPTTFQAPRSTYSHFVQVLASPDGSAAALHYPERKALWWVPRAGGFEGASRRTPWALPFRSRVADFLPSGALAALTAEGLVVDAPDGTRLHTWPDIRGQAVRVAPDGRHVAIARAAEVVVLPLSSER